MHTGDEPPFAGGRRSRLSRVCRARSGSTSNATDTSGRALWIEGKWTISPRLAATFRPPQGDIRYALAYGRAGDMAGSRLPARLHQYHEFASRRSPLCGGRAARYVVHDRWRCPVSMAPASKRFPARVGTPWRWDKPVYRRRSAGRRYGPGARG